MNTLYENQLNNMLTGANGGYQATPGFQFALNTGLEGVNRTYSKQRGSGNELAALFNYGNGMANQEYGSQMDRLGKLQGQEQQYDLGQGQLANTATRNANDFQLGQSTNATNNQRDWWNYDLGKQQNANAANRDKLQYGQNSSYGGYGVMPNANQGYQPNWNQGRTINSYGV